VFAGSLSGGDERQVVDAVYRWDFFPVDRGLYYIMRPDPRRRPYDFELRVKDFASGRTVVLNKFTALDVVGLTVSPDRQIVVSSGVRASAGSDLMLIQNFR
jgi:hypothetical protein